MASQKHALDEAAALADRTATLLQSLVPAEVKMKVGERRIKAGVAPRMAKWGRFDDDIEFRCVRRRRHMSRNQKLKQ